MKEFVKIMIVASLAGAVTAVVMGILKRPESSDVQDPVKTVYVQGKAVTRSVEGLDELLELRKTVGMQELEIRRLQQEIDDLTNGQVRVVKSAVAKSRKSYINRIEEEDPDRHRRILERLHAKNEQTVQALADSAEFLFNLDMESMTPEQAENHQELLDLMEDSWKQTDIMQADPQSAEAKEAKAKLRSNVMAMRKAYTTERQAAIEQLYRQKGFSADEAFELRGELEDVYEQTDPSSIIPGTSFVGENVMISVDSDGDGKSSQTIQLNMSGSLEMK